MFRIRACEYAHICIWLNISHNASVGFCSWLFMAPGSDDCHSFSGFKIQSCILDTGTTTWFDSQLSTFYCSFFLLRRYKDEVLWCIVLFALLLEDERDSKSWTLYLGACRLLAYLLCLGRERTALSKPVFSRRAFVIKNLSAYSIRATLSRATKKWKILAKGGIASPACELAWKFR